MNFTEKKLTSRSIYNGKIMHAFVDKVQLPDGSESEREYIRHSGGAAVLLVVDGKVALVKQYRYVYGKEIYEIPAGKLEKGEQPIKAAERELSEETGYRAKLTPLLKLYPSPGYTDEVIHIFLATDPEYSGAHPDEGEFISCEFMPLEKVLSLIESGEICDAKTVSAIYKYLAK